MLTLMLSATGTGAWTAQVKQGRSRVTQRAHEWTSAVKAARLAHRSPYALRHTFATFGIAAGVSLFELVRFMGTSVEQIDRTHGHLLPDALDRTRQVLDSFVEAGSERLAEVER